MPARRSAWMGMIAAGRSLCRRRVNLVRIEAKLVVNLALFLVAENVIGLRDFLELLLGLFISRIHIRMVFSRKFAEGLADFVRSGRLLYAQNCIIIFALCRRHRLLIFIVLC